MHQITAQFAEAKRDAERALEADPFCEVTDMYSIGLFGMSRPAKGYKVIARNDHHARAAPIEKKTFANKEEAKHAMKEAWPDVDVGPEVKFSGAGYRVAQAINKYDLYMASDKNDDTVWIMVVEAREAKKALKAFKNFIRHWEVLYKKAQRERQRLGGF